MITRHRFTANAAFEVAFPPQGRCPTEPGDVARLAAAVLSLMLLGVAGCVPAPENQRELRALAQRLGYAPSQVVTSRTGARELPPRRRAVALTFDDLPGFGLPGQGCVAAPVERATRQLLAALERSRAPAIGFVNEGVGCRGLNGPDIDHMLSLWIEAGHQLGNHTYSHPDINATALPDYIADIERGETILGEVLARHGNRLSFFRHPMLHTGADPATRAGLQEYLDRRGLRIAPVTIDNQEFVFARRYGLAIAAGDPERARRIADAYLEYMDDIFAFYESYSQRLLHREPAQVLLLHANLLNAQTLPALLDNLGDRGYVFVALEDALTDPAYDLEDGYVGPVGLSWLHRWALGAGLPVEAEPREGPYLERIGESS